MRSGYGQWTSEKPTEADVQFGDLYDAIAFGPRAAILAGPATTHLDCALKLCEAGVHMLIEKPLASDVSGVPELVRRVNARGLTALVGYNLRLAPALVEARRLIGLRAVGDIVAVRSEVGQYLPDWRKDSHYELSVSARKNLGGGPLLELSHEFDYIYWIFGLPKRVTARGGRYSDLKIDVEDIVEIVLEYEDPKRIINVHLDFLQRPADRCCRFIGTNGTMLLNFIANRLRLYLPDTDKWQEVDFELGERDRIYRAELKQFLSCIEGGGFDLPQLSEAYDVLLIADAAARSMQEDRTVELTKG